MKAITLTQPWATLMAAGAKTIETRSWYPTRLKRGEWVAIHAAKGFAGMDVEDFCELCVTEPFRAALVDAYTRGLIQKRQPHGKLVPADLPRGAVVAVARFDCARKTEHVTGISPEERAFGNYAMGRWAWLLDKVIPLVPAIPARGQLYVWDWSPPTGFLPGIVTPAMGAPVMQSLWGHRPQGESPAEDQEGDI